MALHDYQSKSHKSSQNRVAILRTYQQIIASAKKNDKQASNPNMQYKPRETWSHDLCISTKNQTLSDFDRATSKHEKQVLQVAKLC